MTGTVVFLKRYDKKWGVKLEGEEGLFYSFDEAFAHIEKGDSIEYTLVTKGKYTNLVLGSTPSRDVNADVVKPDVAKPAKKEHQWIDNSSSIEAQVVLKCATEFLSACVAHGQMNVGETGVEFDRVCTDMARALAVAKKVITQKPEAPEAPVEETVVEPL